jgi:serine/threonine-protein kinase
MAGSAPVLADRYELHDRIGGGGMGEVWRATDRVLGRTVAVKVILQALIDEPTFLRRFHAEAKAMAKVHHPGIVAIHDFKGDDTGAYLVMEYVEGEPLSRLLARAGRLSPSAVMSVVRQAGIALALVHNRGIVHRDIKPANLLIRPDGTVVLADFGVAMGTGITNAGFVLGTPAYLAPEQVSGGTASARSDIYSLGVVAYECLSGRLPFVGENPIAIATMRVRRPPPPLPGDIPPQVAAVVDRAMALNPEGRWSSAADIAGAAQRAMPGPRYEDPTVVILRDTPLKTKEPTASTVRLHSPTVPDFRPARRRRRRRILATLLGAVLLLTGAYLAWRQGALTSLTD